MKYIVSLRRYIKKKNYENICAFNSSIDQRPEAIGIISGDERKKYFYFKIEYWFSFIMCVKGACPAGPFNWLLL